MDAPRNRRQLAGLNILTDPMWSQRASPVQFSGPRRWVPPGIAFADLPPIDIVLQSHNHYDHLDDYTVRCLARDHPGAAWAVPAMVPIHWGTFKLTDEAMDEPPVRARAAWLAAGLPIEAYRQLVHGETITL